MMLRHREETVFPDSLNCLHREGLLELFEHLIKSFPQIKSNVFHKSPSHAEEKQSTRYSKIKS